MSSVVSWRRPAGTCRALVLGDSSLAHALAAELRDARADAVAMTAAQGFEAVVAERHALAETPDEVLKGCRVVALLDPSEADRFRALHALAGHSATRLIVVPSPDATVAAEHTLLLMLALARHLFHAYSAVVAGERRPGVVSHLTDRQHSAPNWAATPNPIMLCGKTLGLLGLGRVGQAVASRASALGMRVIYFDRERKPAAELRDGLMRRRFDQVLREADIVSLHLPITDETLRLIDAPELALMKPDSTLINTAHGRLIDEGSLIKALRERLIGGAGLDVFAYEPLPVDSPLLGLDNVVLTPHIGGMSTQAARQEMTRQAAAALRTHLP